MSSDHSFEFLLWQYLNQPLFAPNVKTMFNPHRFWHLRRVQFLERCWRNDCIRLLERCWQNDCVQILECCWAKALAPEPEVEPEKVTDPPPPSPRKPKKVMPIILAIGAIAAGGFGYHWWQYASTHEETDNATVAGNVHPISSRIVALMEP